MPQETVRTKAELRAIEAEGWSEAEFTAYVIQYAQEHGWKAHHDRPARTARGKWKTAVQGDPGFPDVLLARQHPKFGYYQVYALELKTQRGRATPEQETWLAAFGPHVGGLLRPKDIEAIEKMLA